LHPEEREFTDDLGIEAYAKTVFGSQELATEWLSSFNLVLGAAPNTLLSNPEGLAKVQHVLLSIEQGLPV